MTERKELILVGGGGHCRSCIDVIEAEGKWEIAGIVDREERKGQRICGYEIMATDKNLPQLAMKYKNFLITLGQIKEVSLRRAIYQRLKELKVNLPVVISPLAHVSGHAHVGEGSIVMHQALINAGSKIGVNCIINNKVLVEHDVVINDHCHMATACVVNGQCSIGEGSFLGSNSIVLQNRTIVPGSVVGAGAVVVDSIEEPGTYVGQPARKLVGA